MHRCHYTTTTGTILEVTTFMMVKLSLLCSASIPFEAGRNVAHSFQTSRQRRFILLSFWFLEPWTIYSVNNVRSVYLPEWSTEPSRRAAFSSRARLLLRHLCLGVALRFRGDREGVATCRWRRQRVASVRRYHIARNTETVANHNFGQWAKCMVQTLLLLFIFLYSLFT